MKTEAFQMVKLVAEEGYIFARRIDGELLGPVLYLGKNDSADNYTEVFIPVPAEGEEDV